MKINKWNRMAAALISSMLLAGMSKPANCQQQPQQQAAQHQPVVQNRLSPQPQQQLTSTAKKGSGAVCQTAEYILEKESFSFPQVPGKAHQTPAISSSRYVPVAISLVSNFDQTGEPY